MAISNGNSNTNVKMAISLAKTRYNAYFQLESFKNYMSIFSSPVFLCHIYNFIYLFIFIKLFISK